MTEPFAVSVAFQDGEDLPLEEAFKLSTWGKDNWKIEDGRLVILRDRPAEIARRKTHVLEMYGEPHSWMTLQNAPWIALSLGDRDWLDYTVTATVEPTAAGHTGIAFRRDTARHYYAFLLEEGNRIALYRREHDEFTLLAAAGFPHDKDRTYTLSAMVEGDAISCSVDGGPELSATDDEYSTGGVAVLTDRPAAYASLEVRGTRRLKHRTVPDEALTPTVETRIPVPEGANYADCRYRFLHLDGETHLFFYDQVEKTITCVSLDGSVVSKLGPWENRVGMSGDTPFQVFDLDGDGKNELVVLADFQVQVYDPRNGKLLDSVNTPPNNPYNEWREHDGPRLHGDAICPVRPAPHGPSWFYIKDRYSNIWLLDHDLEIRWTQARNTGHFPLPVDVNGDGREEILCGHALLDIDGNVLWEVDLDDHFDKIGYFDLLGNGKKELYVMAGEEGILRIDPDTGKIIRQEKLGHVQNGTVGRFIPGRDDFQILVSTLWREPGIHYLLDGELNEYARWTGEHGSQWPIPWGKRDLYLFGEHITDPLSGETLFTIGGEKPLHQNWVLDWPGLGPSRIAAITDGEIVIYGPASAPVTRPSPLRPFYSGYLPRGLPTLD